MIYYNLGFVFMAPAISSIVYDNIVVNKIMADIWERGLKT